MLYAGGGESSGRPAQAKRPALGGPGWWKQGGGYSQVLQVDEQGDGDLDALEAGGFVGNVGAVGGQVAGGFEGGLDLVAYGVGLGAGEAPALHTEGDVLGKAGAVVAS